MEEEDLLEEEGPPASAASFARGRVVWNTLAVDTFAGKSGAALLAECRRLAASSDAHGLVRVAVGLFARGLRRLGMRALALIVEIGVSTGDARALRGAAFVYLEQGDRRRAAAVLRRVAEMRSEEPQAKHDLAIACSGFGFGSGSGGASEKIGLLSEVALGEWDRRFSQVEIVATMDLWRALQGVDVGDACAVAAFSKLAAWAPSLGLLGRGVAVDMRAVLRWDTDVVDVDLEVLEPNGERCTTFHNTTTCGGIRSRDLACGLGPEEYLVRHAQLGCYTVFAKLCSFNGKPPCDVAASVAIDLLFGDACDEAHFDRTVVLHEAGVAVPLVSISFV